MGFNPGFTEVLPGVGGKGRRGFATLSLENEREQNRPDIPVGKRSHTMLELTHIQKSFDGVTVLKDISMQVEEGEIVSILGAFRLRQDHLAESHFRHCRGRRGNHLLQRGGFDPGCYGEAGL